MFNTFSERRINSEQDVCWNLRFPLRNALLRQSIKWKLFNNFLLKIWLKLGVKGLNRKLFFFLNPIYTGGGFHLYHHFIFMLWYRKFVTFNNILSEMKFSQNKNLIMLPWQHICRHEAIKSANNIISCEKTISSLRFSFKIIIRNSYTDKQFLMRNSKKSSFHKNIFHKKLSQKLVLWPIIGWRHQNIIIKNSSVYIIWLIQDTLVNDKVPRFSEHKHNLVLLKDRYIEKYFQILVQCLDLFKI